MKESFSFKKEKVSFKETSKEKISPTFYEAALSSCEKKLENAFEKIAKIVGEKEKIEDLIKLKFFYFKARNRDLKEARAIEKEYQTKVKEVKERLIDEIFNPKRKFEPAQIEPWQRETVEKKEKYSQRFYSQDLALLRDRAHFLKLKEELSPKKANEILQRRRKVFLKHLVLKDLIGFSPEESELDFFYKRNKKFRISEMLKEGAYFVKFFNREKKDKKKRAFLDRGAIKLELETSQRKKKLVKVKEISENLKGIISQEVLDPFDKNLPLWLKIVIQKFLKEEKEKLKQGA